MPLNVLVEAPGGNLASPAELTSIGQLEQKIAALPDIQSVSSVVDPTGQGGVSAVLKPGSQMN